MTTSPYDTLPTGKQALAPTSGESIEEKPSITGNPAAPADPLPSAKAPNPITAPYGGYEEISLEEAARLATPVISQSQDSGSSPAANRNSGDPGSAKLAASQPASAPDTAMKKIQSAASARTDTQFGDVNNTGNAGSAGTASRSVSLSIFRQFRRCQQFCISVSRIPARRRTPLRQHPPAEPAAHLELHPPVR